MHQNWLRAMPLALSSTLCLIAACTVGGDTGDGSGVGNGAGSGTQTCAASGGFGLECSAEMLVVDTDTTQSAQPLYTISTGDIGPSGLKTFNFSIRNVGSANLKVSKIELAYDPQSADEQGNPAYACMGHDKKECAGTGWPEIKPVDNNGSPLSFSITYRHIADAKKRTAQVRIHSNSKDKALLTIGFTTAAGAPKVKVSPEIMDFEFVQIGDQRIRKVRVTNVGNADLVISALNLEGLQAGFFVVILSGKELASGARHLLEPPVTIAKNGSLEIEAIYEGKDDLPHNGSIILETNDPNLTHEGGAGHKAVEVKVNSTGPCLLVLPKVVSFGAQKVGGKGQRPVTLQSCGDLPAVITDIQLLPGSSDEFAIDWSSVPALDGQAPTAAKPLEVAVNGQVKLTLTYSPDAPNPVKDGQPVPDKGEILIASNIIAKTSKVQLEGVASSEECPTALFTIAEGETVVPQTLLHLDGTLSLDPAGGLIDKYKWEVDQPKGSVELFKPSPGAPQVLFQPNVAGTYVFRLRVYNQLGKESCFAAEKTVTVLPDEAIHVELLWNTPGDKDQSDEGPEAGSDMDLHFAHAYASGLDFDGDGAADPWFDPKYDAFWFNKGPEWGSYDPNVDDNPSLDRDDTDGAGPENLNLTLPEDGLTYHVGVHYFDDHGKGASQADVRIYIYGQLKFQQKSKDLVHKDMWNVATIAWPTGTITAKGNKQQPYFVTAKYPHPEL